MRESCIVRGGRVVIHGLIGLPALMIAACGAPQPVPDGPLTHACAYLRVETRHIRGFGDDDVEDRTSINVVARGSEVRLLAGVRAYVLAWSESEMRASLRRIAAAIPEDETDPSPPPVAQHHIAWTRESATLRIDSLVRRASRSCTIPVEDDAAPTCRWSQEPALFAAYPDFLVEALSHAPDAYFDDAARAGGGHHLTTRVALGPLGEIPAVPESQPCP